MPRPETPLEPRRLRAVFLDVYNTLARFLPEREEVQRSALRALGLDAEPSALRRGYALADAFWAQENARRPLRLRTPEERRDFLAEYERRILQGAGLEVDRDTALRVWEEVRRIRYELALFPDVPAGLKALRAMGYTLGVISNLDRPGPDLLAWLGLAGLVDFAVTSQEAGADKPDPAIFRLALERAGVTPTEAVHVGDQPLSDRDGAWAAGLHAVLMDRYGALNPAEAGCPVVGDMEGLVTLLRR